MDTPNGVQQTNAPSQKDQDKTTEKAYSLAEGVDIALFIGQRDQSSGVQVHLEFDPQY